LNILFSTQSDSLQLFNSLRNEMGKHVTINKTAFLLSDSWHYQQWLDEHTDFEKNDYTILKEWDVTSKRNNKVDYKELERYENELGGAGLFASIVADRRLFMGPNCTFTQDYRRRFTDEELLSILLEGLKQVESVFDKNNPSCVVTFICVTFFDYLVYLFAKSRGVRFLNLRPTRIKNFVTFASCINDPSPEFIDKYEDIFKSSSKKTPEAKGYIEQIQSSHAEYEGVVKPSDKPAQRVTMPFTKIFGGVKLVRNWYRFRKSISYNDNHCPGVIKPVVYRAVINPLRAKRVNRTLKNHYVTRDDMKGKRFAFYPLHTEPEVSLLVYGKPYVNQIEVIRAIAMSLPADMFLVIKEHPWMLGKRSVDSYRKLLNIPKIKIAFPSDSARYWIESCDLVTILTSSVGLEAVMLQKPVITLGHCPFNAFPESMVRYCKNLSLLPIEIKNLLDDYDYDVKSAESYVAAILELSVGVNLYSELLGRKYTFHEKDSLYQDEISKLSRYLLDKIEH